MPRWGIFFKKSVQEAKILIFSIPLCETSLVIKTLETSVIINNNLFLNKQSTDRGKLLCLFAEEAVVHVGHVDIALGALFAELLEHVYLAIFAEDLHLLVETAAASVGGLTEARASHLPQSVFKVGLLALGLMLAGSGRARVLGILALPRGRPFRRLAFGGISLLLF